MIARGLVQNKTLDSLNLKGNLITDEGMVILADSLRNAK